MIERAIDAPTNSEREGQDSHSVDGVVQLLSPTLAM